MVLYCKFPDCFNNLPFIISLLKYTTFFKKKNQTGISNKIKPTVSITLNLKPWHFKQNEVKTNLPFLMPDICYVCISFKFKTTHLWFFFFFLRVQFSFFFAEVRLLRCIKFFMYFYFLFTVWKACGDDSHEHCIFMAAHKGCDDSEFGLKLLPLFCISLQLSSYSSK